jgi:phosphate transport system permease protein
MSTQAVSPFGSTCRRARRRRLVGKTMEVLSTLAALLAIVVLIIVIGSVLKRGFPALSVDFFTKSPAPFGQTNGGIANAIVGTIIMTAIATAIAVPVGVLTAIFTSQFAPKRLADFIRLMLNVLAGVPTIVIGIFIFGLLVVGHGQSAKAASIALSIVMVPLIARSVDEVLALVPSSLQDASYALGATKARTLLTIVLPAAISGIVTASVVAAARAAGETAPLLFTSSIVANTVTTDPNQPMNSIPLSIFVNSESPSTHDQQQAWAAALVLIVGVLVTSSIARILSARARNQGADNG